MSNEEKKKLPVAKTIPYVIIIVFFLVGSLGWFNYYKLKKTYANPITNPLNTQTQSIPVSSIPFKFSNISTRFVIDGGGPTLVVNFQVENISNMEQYLFYEDLVIKKQGQDSIEPYRLSGYMRLLPGDNKECEIAFTFDDNVKTLEPGYILYYVLDGKMIPIKNVS